LALKCARNKRGIEANKSEYGVWQNASEVRRDLLCPSLRLLLGGQILLARRAEPVSEEEFKRDWLKRALAWDYRGPGDESFPFECKAIDWGKLEGRLVAVDYANTQALINSD